MRRILWPKEQRAEHEQAKKIALKWRTRNMSLIDRFIERIRTRNPIGVDPKNPIAIGGERNPTYWRWYVWPRNRFVNCYLHNFLRDDEEDLHDHRMVNISVVLSRVGYKEELFLRQPHEGEPLPGTYMKRVRYLFPRVRLPSTPHRVVLNKLNDGTPIPIWSLFIGFPHWRNWGFWCPGNGRARWVPWEKYVLGQDPTSSAYGTRGAGCGE